MFAALVEFNSLQDAIDCYKSEEYQSALAELGEKPEESVIRNLSIFEGLDNRLNYPLYFALSQLAIPFCRFCYSILLIFLQ